MRMVLLLTLLVGCAGGQPYARGAPGLAPAPVRPTYTPPGAGLPGERMPDMVRPQVPRSRGRVLPPSDGPGLWSAETPRASAGGARGAMVVGVAMPEADDGTHSTASGCAQSANRALAERSTLREKLESLPESYKRCLVARLFSHCVDTELKVPGDFRRYRGWAKLDAEVRYKERQQEKHKADKLRADAFMRDACDGVQMDQYLYDIIRPIMDAWSHSLEARR